MRGRFTAVTHGTWETESRFRPLPVIGLGLAAALIGWLLTVLWLLACVVAAAVVTVAAGCWVLTRRNDRDAELLAERWAGLRAESDRPAIAPAAPAVVNHYHLHLPPGATAEGLNWAIPERDAITTTEE